MFANADDGNNKLFFWKCMRGFSRSFGDRECFRIHLSAFFPFVFVYIWTDNFINRRDWRFRNFSYNVDDSSQSKHPWTRILLSVNEITIGDVMSEKLMNPENSSWIHADLNSFLFTIKINRRVVKQVIAGQHCGFNIFQPDVLFFQPFDTQQASLTTRWNWIQLCRNRIRLVYYIFAKRPEVRDENFN